MCSLRALYQLMVKVSEPQSSHPLVLDPSFCVGAVLDSEADHRFCLGTIELELAWLPRHNRADLSSLIDRELYAPDVDDRQAFVHRDTVT